MEEQDKSQDKYTREEAIKVFTEMADNLRKKDKVFRYGEFLSILLGTLAPILVTVGSSLQLFKNDNLENLKNNSIFYWLAGLTLLLFIVLIFIPRLIKKLKVKSTPKEVLLKEQIIEIFSKVLDKTIINPSFKKGNEI